MVWAGGPGGPGTGKKGNRLRFRAVLLACLTKADLRWPFDGAKRGAVGSGL